MRQRERITKRTTTSRIALIGIAAATMMITLSIIAIQQEASAANPTNNWCFLLEDEGIPVGLNCFPSESSSISRQECQRIQAIHDEAASPCRPFESFH